MKITIEVDLATGAVSATREGAEGAAEATAEMLSTPPSIGVNAGPCAGAGLPPPETSATVQGALGAAPPEARPGFHVDTFTPVGNGPAPGALDAGAPQ
jgi:hypothetical protein